MRNAGALVPVRSERDWVKKKRKEKVAMKQFLTVSHWDATQLSAGTQQAATVETLEGNKVSGG